ncbi:MAG: helix-turn-helix domain-containing protein [Deltaproteobacteria bacterium]|nr:helix-turn-helix domain-containing protein [Deltaproteobacteria bacterium]
MKLTPRLKRFRTERGLTQQALAVLAGLSRQALNQIENGSAVPSTAVALQLGRALGCRVEELFQLAEPAAQLTAHLAEPLRPTTTTRSQRALVGRVNGRLIAHRLDPQQRPADLSRAADALVTRTKARTCALRPLLPLERLEDTLLLAGCDPALGLLAGRVNQTSPAARTLWLEATSGAALSSLERAELHVAGAHLFDQDSGDYNVPFVQRAFAGRPMVVVTLAQLQEGLCVARSNPKRIRRVADLARADVRLMNRDPSAAARRLLDRLLAREGLSGTDIAGYDTSAPGHLEAAAAVATGAADAAIVTCGTALALDLHFIPLAEERFDLVFPKDALADARVRLLMDTLSSSALRRELDALGGYVTRRSGSIAAELN